MEEVEVEDSVGCNQRILDINQKFESSFIKFKKKLKKKLNLKIKKREASLRRDQRFSGLLDQGLIGRKMDLPINPRANLGVQNLGHVVCLFYDGVPGSVFNFLGSAT